MHRSIDGRPTKRVLVVPRVQELYGGPPHARLKAEDDDHREVLVFPHLGGSVSVFRQHVVREQG